MVLNYHPEILLRGVEMRLEELRLNGSDCNLSGLKIAKVIKNTDPKAQERVWVRVIGVHDMESTDPEYHVEAHHGAPSKSNSGEIPDVDDFLYGMFVDNDPNHFVWMSYCRNTGG